MLAEDREGHLRRVGPGAVGAGFPTATQCFSFFLDCARPVLFRGCTTVYSVVLSSGVLLLGSGSVTVWLCFRWIHHFVYNFVKVLEYFRQTPSRVLGRA